MGNVMIRRNKKAKVMKINGETFKLKTPAQANDVVKHYPGHALLDSQAVKQFGLRAKPLEPYQELKPKKIYFLVELPKLQPEPVPRRARSTGLRGMNAMERLDFLMLSKRSVSDVSLVKRSGLGEGGAGLVRDGSTRVKMRLPKAQLDRLMEESCDGTEVAEKILSLYMGNNAAVETGGGTAEAKIEIHNQRSRRKRVSFSPVEEGDIHEEAGAQ
ncbi:unnamed protein product [Vicia faba]|uniref:Plastid movement impaired 2 n=1 Tax=Vicia faba TaxID=3906 RepID=A0AAV0ZHF5_VICFA|nr:unnamed protein product [Vicia faba]